jgi:UDP-N-acetylmuramate-alanine ligase
MLQADEYDGCFLGVSPSLAVVTNVEWEHVDMFPDYVCFLTLTDSINVNC